MRLSIELDLSGEKSLVPFESLISGDMFMYENHIYIRSSAHTLYSTNAVRLDTGDTYIFDLNREVIRLESFRKEVGK